MRTSAIEYTHTAEPLNTDLEMQKEKEIDVLRQRQKDQITQVLKMQN